jgi:ribosomal protein L12E/L44/L45/RPP1/RPP2
MNRIALRFYLSAVRVPHVQAQLPEVVKALSGVDLNNLLAKLEKIGDKPAEGKK